MTLIHGPADFPVRLPAAQIVLLRHFRCIKCLGHRFDLSAARKHLDAPCDECNNVGMLGPGSKMFVDTWACHMVERTMPKVVVYARLRYPFRGRTGPGEMSTAMVSSPAWGHHALMHTALSAAIDACRGSTGNGFDSGLTGASLVHIELTGDIAWPEGWLRTRRVPDQDPVSIARAKLDWPDGQLLE